jgi:glycerophosphoryl diester phosphodiesterase
MQDPGFPLISSMKKIPRLEEIFSTFSKSLFYDIEIKSNTKNDTGIEAKLIELISKYDLKENVLISSFNPYPLARIKRLDQKIPRSIIFSTDKAVPWYLRRGQGRFIGSTDILKPDYRDKTSFNSFLDRFLGYSFIPWTVDSPADAVRMIGLGASGLISNDPKAVREALK